MVMDAPEQVVCKNPNEHKAPWRTETYIRGTLGNHMFCTRSTNTNVSFQSLHSSMSTKFRRARTERKVDFLEPLGPVTTMRKPRDAPPGNGDLWRRMTAAHFSTMYHSLFTIAGYAQLCCFRS
jgi:hypothetical protein